MLKILISLLFIPIFLPIASSAGIFEVGASANLRRSTLNEDNYQESESYTGSISYYFTNNLAFELSYTKGVSNVLITGSAPTDLPLRIQTDFQMTGADVIFSLGDKQSTLQPSVKMGVAQIVRQQTLHTDGVASLSGAKEKETVPSTGLGLKIRLTQTFSLKLGIDAWLTEDETNDTKTFDYAGRIGFSMLF